MYRVGLKEWRNGKGGICSWGNLSGVFNPTINSLVCRSICHQFYHATPLTCGRSPLQQRNSTHFLHEQTTLYNYIFALMLWPSYSSSSEHHLTCFTVYKDCHVRLHLEKIVSFKLSFGKIYCAALPWTEIMESYRKNSPLTFFLDALASHVYIYPVEWVAGS